MEDTQPVPASNSSQSNSRLGELVASYHGQHFRWRDFFLLVIPGFVGTLGLIGYGLWRMQNQAMQVGYLQAFNQNQVWFILGYLLFLFFFSMTMVRIGDDLRFVSIYRNGLRWRLGGIRIHTADWDEMKGIATSSFRDYFINVPMREHYHAMLYPAHGKPFAIYENLHDLPELVSRIKASLYPHLLPQYQADLGTGKQLAFGALGIQPGGLQIHTKLVGGDFAPGLKSKSAPAVIPWSNIEQVTIQSGFLVVQSSDYGLQRIPISQIPNYELFFKLIEQGLKR